MLEQVQAARHHRPPVRSLMDGARVKIHGHAGSPPGSPALGPRQNDASGTIRRGSSHGRGARRTLELGTAPGGADHAHLLGRGFEAADGAAVAGTAAPPARPHAAAAGLRGVDHTGRRASPHGVGEHAPAARIAGWD